MKSAAHWIPVPGHPMHSSNTSFLFLSSFLIPICSSISVDGIPFSQCQNLEKGIIHHRFIYLSFFHLNRSLIIVVLTSLAFTEYVPSFHSYYAFSYHFLSRLLIAFRLAHLKFFLHCCQSDMMKT